MRVAIKIALSPLVAALILLLTLLSIPWLWVFMGLMGLGENRRAHAVMDKCPLVLFMDRVEGIQ